MSTIRVLALLGLIATCCHCATTSTTKDYAVTGVSWDASRGGLRLSACRIETNFFLMTTRMTECQSFFLPIHHDQR